MGVLLLWLEQHWFDLVQTFGIIASIAFTAASIRRDQKGRRMSDYLTLTGHHRELWADVHRRPELARIFEPELDLIAQPISVAEEEFLNLVIVHFSTGWLMAKAGGLVTLELLSADARAFFSLPLPRDVWLKTTHFRDPDFVGFVESALAKRRSQKSWFWRMFRAFPSTRKRRQ